LKADNEEKFIVGSKALWLIYSQSIIVTYTIRSPNRKLFVVSKNAGRPNASWGIEHGCYFDKWLTVLISGSIQEGW